MKQIYSVLTLLLFLSQTYVLQAQSWTWAVNAKGSNQYSDADNKIATDHEGNSFVVGYYTKTFTLGNFTLINPSDYYSQIYFAKLDATGNVLWLKNIDAGNSYAYGISITLDDTGNAYVTGSINNKIFVAKYDLDGKHIWTNNFSGEFSGHGKSIALDQADNVYVTGKGGSTTYYLGGAFLAKINNEGKTIWTKVFKSECHTNGASGGDIAVDALGNSYITGLFACTTLDFDGIKIQNSGGWSDKGFLAMVNPDGKTVWAKQIPYLVNLLPQIALTESNELVVAGYCCSYSYPQVQKYSSQGDLEWITQGKTYDGTPKEIKTDYDGNIYLGGISFGNYGGSYMDFHVEKFSPTGQQIWRREVKTNAGEYLYGLSLDNAGNAYVVGRSSIEGIGVLPPSTSGSSTIFIAKLNTESTTHLRPYKPQLNSVYPVCEGEPVPQLEAAGQNISWYSSPLLQTKIQTGKLFTPSVTETDTFYVTQTIDNRRSWGKPVTIYVSDLEDFTLKESGDTLYAPYSGKYTYEWYFDESLIQDSKLHYYVPDTTGVFKVVVSDKYCSKESSIDTTPLNESTFEIYPNPAPGIVKLNVLLKAKSDLQINVYNTTGNKLLMLHENNRLKVNTEIDISHLKDGLYFMEFISNSERKVIRLIKN